LNVLNKLRKHGITESIRIGKNLTFDKIISSLPENLFHRVTAVRRQVLSNRISSSLNNEVQYGCFKNLKLSNMRWGSHDKAAMLLGTYEYEVLVEIEKASINKEVFVDVGAADGYFAVGAVFSSLYKKSICFEISGDGRASIATNALENNVLDKVEILGEATADSLLEILINNDPKSLFLLCDIEGGEFELFTPEILSALSDSTMLIEIHDFSDELKKSFQKLKDNALQHFQIQEITQEARNPNLSVVSSSLHDDDKWLLMSEGRPRAMTWLLLSPKNSDEV
jgi:hypothetical protein